MSNPLICIATPSPPEIPPVTVTEEIGFEVPGLTFSVAMVPVSEGEQGDRQIVT